MIRNMYYAGAITGMRFVLRMARELRPIDRLWSWLYV